MQLPSFVLEERASLEDQPFMQNSQTHTIPNDAFIPSIDICLRHVTHALIKGATDSAANNDIGGILVDNDELQ